MVLLNILCIAQDVLNSAALCLCIPDVAITTRVVELRLTIIIVLAGRNIRITEVKLVVQTAEWLPDVFEVYISISIEVDPVNPDNACTIRITAAAGTYLAGAS